MALGWRWVGWSTAVIALAAVGTVIVGAVGVDYYTSTPEFCGNTCHLMKPAYESWKISEHKNLNCLDCHATTEEKPRPFLSFQGLKQAYSYVMRDGKGEHPRIRPVINDLSCAASGCHTGQDLLKKESDFAKREVIRFIHLSHKVKAFDKIQVEGSGEERSGEETRAEEAPKQKGGEPEKIASVRGHELHCDTCHVHRSIDKHFEVPKEVCFLCHFKKQGFNKGRSTCKLCHDIPQTPLQKQKAAGDKGAITHQKLIDSGVSCQACHRQVISGTGEIKTENCRSCHLKPEVLAKTGPDNMELLHRKHVAGQQASCFDCHQPIEHKNGGDFLDLVRLECQNCHPDHHRFQKVLLTGPKRDGVRETPNPMFRVKTNCLGCHIEKGIHQGQPFFTGSKRACIACHSETEGNLLVKWRQQMAEEVGVARKLEEEAKQAIVDATGRVPAEKLAEAEAMLAKGQKNLHIVEYGNGVHNKKYAIMLLDEAAGSFQDLVDVLKRQ